MNTQGIPPEEDEVGERLVKQYVVRRRGCRATSPHMVVFLASAGRRLDHRPDDPGQRRLLVQPLTATSDRNL